MATGKDLWNEFETVLVNHDVEGLVSLYTSDAVWDAPGMCLEGTEAIRAYYQTYFKSCSDTRIETSLVIEDGAFVVAEWTSWDTNTGPVMLPDGTEIPATGKTMELPGVSVVEIRNGRFGSVRDHFDSTVWMTQLGLLPGN